MSSPQQVSGLRLTVKFHQAWQKNGKNTYEALLLGFEAAWRMDQNSPMDDRHVAGGVQA